jgi:anti-sigma factor RsiW
MVRPEELEQISRSLEGELSAEDRAELERALRERPELAAARAQMQALLAASALLPQSLDEARAERLVRGVLSRVHSRKRARGSLAAAGLAAALAGAVAWRLPTSPVRSFEVGEMDGIVLVNGEPFHRDSAIPRAMMVETGPASAVRFRSDDASLVLSSNTRLLVDGREGERKLQLIAGVLGVESQRPVRIHAGAVMFVGEGRSVAMMEPDTVVDRATEQLERQIAHGGSDMYLVLRNIVIPAVTVAATVGLVVLDGEASVLQPESSPIRVAAGSNWTAPRPPSAAKAKANSSGAGDLATQVAALQAEQAALQQSIAKLEKRLDRELGDDTDRERWVPISGQVVDAAGRPVSGADVVVSADGVLRNAATSDGQGGFTLTQPPSERAFLFAHSKGRTARIEGPLRAAGHVLRLVEPGTVEVTVRSRDGSPVQKVQTWRTPGRLPVPLPGVFGNMESFTDAQFVMTNVPAGEVALHVVAEGSPSRAGHALVKVEPGRTARVQIEVEVSTSSVSGQVVDASTGKPMKKYVANLLMPDDSLEAMYQPDHPMFLFTGRSPGERVVLIFAKGYKPTRVRATVEPGKPLDLGTISLEPTPP